MALVVELDHRNERLAQPDGVLEFSKTIFALEIARGAKYEHGLRGGDILLELADDETFNVNVEENAERVGARRDGSSVR